MQIGKIIDGVKQARVYGQVVYADNGPLAGVVITARRGEFSETTVTDADGKYEFWSLEPGDYELTAEVKHANPDQQWPRVPATNRVTVSGVTLCGVKADFLAVRKSN